MTDLALAFGILQASLVAFLNLGKYGLRATWPRWRRRTWIACIAAIVCAFLTPIPWLPIEVRIPLGTGSETIFIWLEVIDRRRPPGPRRRRPVGIKLKATRRLAWGVPAARPT